MTTIRTTKYPALCPHCSKFTTNPPAHIRLLGAWSEGSTRKVYHTVASAARAGGISRQHAATGIAKAVREGLLKLVMKGTYRRTAPGKVAWFRWARAGWRRS